MLVIQENIDLKNFSTMKIGGTATYFAELHHEQDIVESISFASKHAVPYIVVGEGSNMIWSNIKHELLLLKNNIAGFEILTEDTSSVTLKIGAGENWDSVVARCVDMGFSGIEAMSAIPGTVGATPVQNVGAYGQEIQDTLVAVEVYDRVLLTFCTLSKIECKLRYRNSIFKTEEKGRYIIVRVIIHLSKLSPTLPVYSSLVTYLQEHSIDQPSVKDIRMAVIAIRKNKLPDPAVIPNCGSFFKNPIVDMKTVEQLLRLYPQIPLFTVNETHQKISAGWLVENVGYKGQEIGNIHVYAHNALVITNPNSATFEDLQFAIQEITQKIFQKFGIMLEIEPEIIVNENNVQ